MWFMMKSRQQLQKWYFIGLTFTTLAVTGWLVWEHNRPAKAYAKWFAELDTIDRILVMEEVNSLVPNTGFTLQLFKEEVGEVEEYFNDRGKRRYARGLRIKSPGEPIETGEKPDPVERATSQRRRRRTKKERIVSSVWLGLRKIGATGRKRFCLSGLGGGVSMDTS